MKYLLPFWLSNIYFLLTAIAGVSVGIFFDNRFDIYPWGRLISVVITLGISLAIFMRFIKPLMLKMMKEDGSKD